MTVSVAEPDVDADGSVYDVAEISQVRITSTTLSITILLSLSPSHFPYLFSSNRLNVRSVRIFEV